MQTSRSIHLQEAGNAPLCLDGSRAMGQTDRQTDRQQTGIKQETAQLWQQSTGERGRERTGAEEARHRTRWRAKMRASSHAAYKLSVLQSAAPDRREPAQQRRQSVKGEGSREARVTACVFAYHRIDLVLILHVQL